MMHHYPDLGSASDWLSKFSANKKYFADLGSVWNFCTHLSDVIWETSSGVAKCELFYQAKRSCIKTGINLSLLFSFMMS